jgi:hypothetical protein
MSGLYFFNFQIDSVKLRFNVDLLRAISFGSYNKTFVVQISMQENIDYIIELYAEILNKEYYLNRIIFEDILTRNIYMTDHYALLLGYNTHITFLHSIY